MPTVIMLSGRLRAGKDFIADHLAQVFKNKRINFADELKREVFGTIRGIAGAPKTFEEFIERKSEYRVMLQDHGQNRRDTDDAHWARRWLSTVTAYRNASSVPDTVICSDCRYPNEGWLGVGGLVHRDAVVVRVICPNKTRYIRIGITDPKAPEAMKILQHDSERSVDFCPFNFVMRGDLEPSMIVPKFVEGYKTWLDLGRPIFTSAAPMKDD
jgi:hypothetical protein